MNGKILFFPMKFCPEIDQIHHLRELQDLIEGSRQDNEEFIAKNGISGYQLALLRINHVKLVRQSWKLITCQ